MVAAPQTRLKKLRIGALIALLLPLVGCGADSTVAQSGDGASTMVQLSQSPQDTKHSGFSLIDDYVLRIGDEVSKDALLYASSETRAILVMSEDLPAPVLLWPRSRRVETLQMLKIARKPGGDVEILPDPVIGVQPSFRVVTPDVKFAVDGVEAALTPKPPLIGLHGLQSMLDHSVAYEQRADAYTPAQDTLDALRQSGRGVRVRVFFGSWCPACGQMVPRIMKVAQQLGSDSSIEVEYYGLPRGFAGEPEAEKYGIRSVPSAVVFVDDVEIGRIDGDQWRRPEQTLSALLGLS